MVFCFGGSHGLKAGRKKRLPPEKRKKTLDDDILRIPHSRVELGGIVTIISGTHQIIMR